MVLDHRAAGLTESSSVGEHDGTLTLTPRAAGRLSVTVQLLAAPP
jgi:hypothetical protein